MLHRIRQVILDHKAFTLASLAMLAVFLVRIPLGTFNGQSVWDSIAHVIFPAVLPPLLYALLVDIKIMPRLRTGAAIVFILMTAVASEAVWEVFEFTMDTFFSTGWQLDNTDTMSDIILSIPGGLIGAIVYTIYYKKRIRR